MKKTAFLSALSVLLVSTSVVAKFNPPEGYVPYSRRQAMTQIGRLDVDKDGRLTKEEFVEKAKHYGSIDKQNVHRAKKRGYYKTPEEQFKGADKDNNGFVDMQELSQYIEDQSKLDRGKARYY